TNVVGEKPVAAICPVELRNSTYNPTRVSPVDSCVDTVNVDVADFVVADAVLEGGEVIPPSYTAETR
ncbi:hypothetical protein, partial [Candidatus Nitrosotalea sp. FS]|uniref:hypothetical protein n=1 Tax=Candidatus Nitrosotalea sp. FS TaxID=2341021 RepID=UPI002107BD09